MRPAGRTFFDNGGNRTGRFVFLHRLDFLLKNGITIYGIDQEGDLYVSKPKRRYFTAKKTVDISKAPLKTNMHDRISVLRGFIIAIETGYDTMFT